MQTENNKKIVAIGDYQITYDQLTDQQMNIYVSSQSSFTKYANKNVKLNSINMKGFEMSLRDNKQFKIQIKQYQKTDMQEQASLQIKIKFESPLLKSVQQIINVPFKCKISQLQLYKSKVEVINQKLKKLRQNNKYETVVCDVGNKTMKSNRDPNYAGYSDEQDYNQLQPADSDYDMVEFYKVMLPDVGKFKVQLTMLLKCSGSYYYLYTDRINYLGPFPSGVMFPTGTQWIPFKVSLMVDNRQTQQKSYMLYAYDIADYPFQAHNIVVSATRIQ